MSPSQEPVDPNSANSQGVESSHLPPPPKVLDIKVTPLIPELTDAKVTRLSKSWLEHLRKQQSPHGLNPMFCDWLPANFGSEGYSQNATLINSEHNQPVAVVRAVSILGAGSSSIMESNQRLEIKLPPGIERYVYSDFANGTTQIIPAEEIVKLAKIGFSGFSQGRNGAIVPWALSNPLHCVVVPIIVRAGISWNIGEAARFVQPLKFHRGAATFPMVGSIYIENKELSADAHERFKVGAAAMPDPETGQGVMAQFPMFASGGRSLLIPCGLRIPVQATPEGGYAFIGEEIVSGKFREQGLEQGKVSLMHGIAVQYIGAGLRRYVYHCASKEPDGRVNLKDGEVILDGSDVPKHDKVSLVQRSAYAGEAGIFLDQLHQPFATCPTGGLSTARQSYERDKLLWKHGARMSGMTLAYVPLLTREELDKELGHASGMVVPQVDIAVRVVFDDTHRLDILAPQQFGDHRTDVSGTFKCLIERDFGEDTPEARERYLLMLCRTIGHNLSVILKCGFSITREQPTADNMSIYGGFVDSENLIERTSRYEALPLVHSFSRDLLNVAAAAGISQPDFLRSPAFDEFVANFLGEEWAKNFQIMQRRLRLEEVSLRIVTTFLTVCWVKKGLEREDKEVNPTGLFQRLIDDPGFRRSLGLDHPELLEQATAVVTRGQQHIWLTISDPVLGPRVHGIPFEQFAREELLDCYLALALDALAPSKDMKHSDTADFQLIEEVDIEIQ